MWQILLTLMLIGFVSASDYDCPRFSNYPNNVNLINELDGEYLIAYTTCSFILDCERIRWTVGPNNTRTAEIKDSDGCCRRIDNFDSSNTDYIEYDITPTSTCSYLPSTVLGRHKLVGAVGTGQSRCYILHVCHRYRKGLLVACRSQPTLLLWVLIRNLLATVLGLLVPIPILESVNQSDCIFSNTCYV